MTVSLIISTYRTPRFLELVLESVLRQDADLLEIIVSEDGDAPENEALVEIFRPRFKVPLVHVRQRDQGNRKPLALNRSLAASRGDYLVFIDGDCVLRRDFVSAHLELARDDAFLTGRRVELSPGATEWLTPERVRAGELDGVSPTLAWDALRGRTQSLGRMIRTPHRLRAWLGREHIDDIRGCNFSVHRKHLLAINGFSNDFSGAYGEDSDAEYRLKFLGLRMRSVKGAAIQYHLWHRSQNKDAENQVRLRAVLDRGEARAADGLGEVGRHE